MSLKKDELYLLPNIYSYLKLFLTLWCFVKNNLLKVKGFLYADKINQFERSNFN